jgi:hypothetical protein
MRTTLFRLLPAAALALPLLALAAFAQEPPAHCDPVPTTGFAPPTADQRVPHAPLMPPGHPVTPEAPICPQNQPPEGHPEVLDHPLIVPPAAPDATTLEEMVKELKQLREKEKKLTEAIRAKVKAQRKALDDAEREVGGEDAPPCTTLTPCCPR